MACPSSDRILDYVERRLTSAERSEIESHLDTCAECRQLVAELARKTAVETPRRNNADAVTTPGSAGARVRNDDAIQQRRIGRYLVEKQLGEGGMGAVYIAHDPSLDRRVALKLVHPELATGDGIERFIREGRALAKLDHPNVVSVFDAGQDGESVYLAMELVDGQSAGSWLLAEERRWREILRIFAAAARGLAAAHAAGITHRDVKPDNLLIGNDGIVRVADFGLAVNTPTPAPSGNPTIDPASRLTHPDAILGTPAFMSPEQWTAGATVGPATDQFSLCAALRLALGSVEHPTWIDEVIERGVANEPGDRFPTMAALADALDPDRRTRKKRLIAAALALPLVAGGITAFALTRPEPVDTFAEQCRIAENDRLAVWSPAEQLAGHAALLHTGIPWAEDVWKKLDREMHRYRDRLGTAHAELCAARPQTERARAASAVGFECLALRSKQGRQFAQQLPGVDPAKVRNGTLLRYFLLPPEDCSNPFVLEAERVARGRPTYKQEHNLVNAEVKRARTAAAAGKTADAIASAQRAAEAARPLATGLTLDTLITLGEVSVPQPAIAEAAFREAAAAAEKLHHDDMRAKALAYLIQILSRQSGREREAIALEPLVTAAMTRAHRGETLTAMVHQALGVAHLALGDKEAALKELRVSLEEARAGGYKNDPGLLPYLPPLADVLIRTGKKDEALAIATEAVTTATTIFGAAHFETGRYRSARARVYAASNQCDAARAEIDAANDALAPLPLNASERLMPARMYAECLMRVRDYAKAVEVLREYSEALRTAGATKSLERAMLLSDIGQIQQRAGNLAEARDAYLQSYALFESVGGKTNPNVARIKAVLDSMPRTADGK